MKSSREASTQENRFNARSKPRTAHRQRSLGFWSLEPVARASLSHETEVARALAIAVPISLALWSPLIAAAVYLF
jgi:hypothetical protein